MAEKKEPLNGKGGWRRFQPLTDDPAKLAQIGILIGFIGKRDVEFLLQNLKLNSEVYKIPKVTDFLAAFMTEAQISVMKVALNEGFGVHFVGKEGTGKSLITNLFSKNGFMQVTEAAFYEPVFSVDDCYAVPRIAKNLVVIELSGVKKNLPEHWEDITENDINSWLKNL